MTADAVHLTPGIHLRTAQRSVRCNASLENGRVHFPERRRFALHTSSLMFMIQCQWLPRSHYDVCYAAER